MQRRTLGRTDLEVSVIGHGLWGMSNWTGSDDAESRAALQHALQLGCNFFDTAWAYGKGKSDRFLGDLHRANPGRPLVLASKIPPLNGKWPGSADDSIEDTFPMEHVLDYTERIREALDVKTIDLLQYHVWSDAWADTDTFRKTVERLKSEKRIRYFGLSLNRWEPENGIRALRTGLVDVVQVIYNILDQAPEDELFPLCKEMNIGVIARVPLDEGSLAGTLTRNTKFPATDWRANYFNAQNLAATVERVEKLRKLIPAGMSMAEMALRFILTNAVVSTTIVGMRRASHVEANIRAGDGKPLDASLLHELKKHRWDRRPAGWSA
jgi:aryl-alcohol dehydrogenase-like predicted oxidoreductase